VESNEYQAAAMRTRGQFLNQGEHLLFAALELNAEAGEFANLVYKHVFQGHPLRPDKMAEELGDTLWGIACSCDALGLDLAQIMEANILKLKKRYPAGFSSEASIARVDQNDNP